MDRPAKRLKISRPDSRSPRDTGSRRTEGLFTSEMGITDKDEDGDSEPAPTRTISLSDLRRRTWSYVGQQNREVLPRGKNGAQLRPRVPDTTVTATVVAVNVNEGTTTVDATEVAAATDSTVISLSSYGSVTVPAESTITTDVSSTISDVSTTIDDSAPTSTSDSTVISTSASSDSTTASSTLNAAESVLSAALNSTITSSTTDRTVTVTATRTFEISYQNGTFVTALSTADSSRLTTSSGSTRLTEITSISISTQVSTQDSTSASGIGLTETGAATGTDGFNSAASSSTSISAASSSAASGPGSGPGLTPVQQQVVGGVVGGVAGMALVLLVLLIFLRMYRKRLKARGQLPEQLASRELTSAEAASANPTSQRSSNVPLAAAMASGFKRWRPQSAQTTVTTTTEMTTSTAPESEKGFQRLAGRKIAPVLSSGGDGFGGNYGAFEKDPVTPRAGEKTPERDLSSGSFYRDSSGFYGGRGSSSPGTPMAGNSRTTTMSAYGLDRGPSQTRDFAEPGTNVSASRPEGFAMMRPSPARTPTTSSLDVSQIRLPMPQGSTVEMDGEIPPTPPIPGGTERGRLTVPDGVGRSLPDGSRGSGSRFREALM